MNSPFVDLGSRITNWELAKMVFLFPIAVVRILESLLLWSAAVALIHCDFADKRFKFIETSQILKPMLNLFVRHILGFSVDIRGLEHFEAGRAANAVIVYNHVSFMDQFIISLHSICSFVTIEAYAKVPIFGKIVTFTNTIL